MIKFSSDEALCEKYEFKKVKIGRIIDISEFNMDNSWYGGKLNRLASIKDTNIIIAVDKDLNTIGVAENGNKQKELDKLTFLELRSLLKKNNIKFTTTETKNDLLKKLSN